MIFKGHFHWGTDQVEEMFLLMCLNKLFDRCVRRKKVCRLTNEEYSMFFLFVITTKLLEVVFVTCYKKAIMNRTTNC